MEEMVNRYNHYSNIFNRELDSSFMKIEEDRVVFHLDLEEGTKKKLNLEDIEFKILKEFV